MKVALANVSSCTPLKCGERIIHPYMKKNNWRVLMWAEVVSYAATLALVAHHGASLFNPLAQPPRREEVRK